MVKTTLKDLRPAAVAAGVVAVAGIILFAGKERRKCTRLPGIWDESGPLHLTEDAQDEAFDLARSKFREYILKGDAIESLNDISMHVADSLRSCDWENLETKQQIQVWDGIKTIVNRVNEEASDTEAFLRSFNG